MAKETKTNKKSKIWIMKVGVVLNDFEETQEGAMEIFQKAVDYIDDDFKIIEVIGAKEASFSFDLTEE